MKITAIFVWTFQVVVFKGPYIFYLIIGFSQICRAAGRLAARYFHIFDTTTCHYFQKDLLQITMAVTLIEICFKTPIYQR